MQKFNMQNGAGAGGGGRKVGPGGGYVILILIIYCLSELNEETKKSFFIPILSGYCPC